MSIFRTLFGSDKVVDGAMSGLDSLIETSEEKKSIKLKFLALYEPFKIAQRFIALILAIPFVFIHVLCCLIDLIFAMQLGITAMELIEAGKPPTALPLNFSVTSDIRASNNTTLGEPLGWVVIFYFAGGAGEGIIGKYLARSDKKG